MTGAIKYIAGAVTLGALGWIAYGVLAADVPQPTYRVVTKKDGYEIREYKPYIMARVLVEGPYQQAMNRGFRILAGYIFGGNTTKTKVAMTAPVMETKPSTKIAMTAPVMESSADSGSRYVSFIMPKAYTLENLPVPNDKRIEIIQVPAHQTAVLQFSWSNSPERFEEKKLELLTQLQEDGYQLVSKIRTARYNPPWTPPFLLRNEVMVDVE